MVSIVIVNYNTREFIFQCLFSIKKYAPRDTEIIVVDNNSSDGSVENIKTQILKAKTTTQNLKLIENKDNLGYAKAVNQGIRASKGDYIFVLNPDTKLTKSAITEMIHFVENKLDAGIVGPRLLNFDGSVQSSCYQEPTLLAAVKEYFWGISGSFEKYYPKADTPVKVDAVVGAAMFIPKSVIEKAGMLSERYFMYFEDLDFCRKVRDAGFSIYYAPYAQIYHKHGGVTGSVSDKARVWLIESSKIYHGVVGYFLLTLILRLGQRWKKLFG